MSKQMQGAENGVKVQRRKIDDYRADPENANLGSDRGRAMIRDSLQRDGAGRSLLADKDGYLIAGNQAMRAALEAGITEVIEVETDGEALVVVKRRDLDLDSDEDQRARRLAYADNRARDFAEWDPTQIAADLEAGLDLAAFFRADELDDLMADKQAEQMVNDAVSGDTSKGRLSGDKQKQIKPVLYVDEIAIFERALQATGIDNRGQAVLEVCRFYLEHKAVSP